MTTIGATRAICLMMLSIGMVAACSTPQQPVELVPSPERPSPAAPLATDNPISAQASVRSTVAASRIYFEKNGDSFEGLDEAYLADKVPISLTFVEASDYFADVSLDVRADDAVAVAAMSPSGACFGSLGNGVQRPSYSHTKVGQAPCNAKDVPYPIPGF